MKKKFRGYRRKSGINIYKLLIKIAFNILVIVAFILVFLYFIQDQELFRPNNSNFYHTYTLTHPGFIQVTISGGNKSYKGIIRKNNNAEQSPLIIFFIGNATNAAEMMYSMDKAGMWDSFLGYNLLIVDYPGYGLSEGTPTADSIYQEAILTYDYAAILPYVDKNSIIAGGVSIGTGPAVYLAAIRNVKGLFLLAPYANGYDLYNNVLPIFHGPLKLLVRNKLMSDWYAPLTDAPVLIVASKNDETVPFNSSIRISACFRTKPKFVTLTGVRHNEILPNRMTLDSIKNFLLSISS